MSKYRLAGFVIGLTALSLTAQSAEWPCFRGPTADGISSERGFRKDWAERAPKTLWTVSLSDNGYAGPSVVGGKVFIIDHRGSEDVVRAIDFETGKDVWSFAYADAPKNRYGFTESTPLVSGGKVYTFSRLAKAFCLDAQTGKQIWSRDLLGQFGGRRPEWDYASSPIMADGRVIFCPGGKTASVVALDPETGKTLWQGGDSAPSYATPILVTLGGQKQLLAFVADGLLSLDVTTGGKLWHFPWKVPNNQNTASPVVWGNNVLFSTAWNCGSVMLDVSSSEPRVLWQNKEMQSRFPSPVLYHDRLYGTQDPGKLVCLDVKSGQKLWQQPGFEFASTIAADDVVMVLEGKSGDLILLDATVPEYKELTRMHAIAGAECWAAPVLSDGRLLVRNKTSMVCLDLR